jgi:hypothetical protein
MSPVPVLPSGSAGAQRPSRLACATGLVETLVVRLTLRTAVLIAAIAGGGTLTRFFGGDLSRMPALASTTSGVPSSGKHVRSGGHQHRDSSRAGEDRGM